LSISRHRQDGRAGEPGNEAAPICKPDVGAIALTGHGHDLLFGRPMGDAKLAKAPMTLDAPAMTKASASRNTENLRGIEAVVSVDRVSSSEGAKGPEILTAALGLLGSGADDTPPSAPRNSKLCQLWVKSVALCNRRPPVDVRYVPVSDRDCVALQYVAKGHKPTFLRNLVEPTKSASARALATPLKLAIFGASILDAHAIAL
jgi:hypothetical protein